MHSRLLYSAIQSDWLHRGKRRPHWQIIQTMFCFCVRLTNCGTRSVIGPLTAGIRACLKVFMAAVSLLNSYLSFLVLPQFPYWSVKVKESHKWQNVLLRSVARWHRRSKVCLTNLQNKLCSLFLSPSFLRHRGEWEEHIHQTDEDHPRHRLLRWGQKRFYQTGVSEHLHVHAGHDPSLRVAQGPLQIWAQQGKLHLRFFKFPPTEVTTVAKGDE